MTQFNLDSHLVSLQIVLNVRLLCYIIVRHIYMISCKKKKRNNHLTQIRAQCRKSVHNIDTKIKINYYILLSTNFTFSPNYYCFIYSMLILYFIINTYTFLKGIEILINVKNKTRR